MLLFDLKPQHFYVETFGAYVTSQTEEVKGQHRYHVNSKK